MNRKGGRNKKCHVFIVDDDISASRGLKRLLLAGGYDVDAYVSADEFVASIGSNVHGCLILDSRLPRMSGEVMVSELRARGCNIAIIVVSGDDDIITRRRANSIQAVGFFRKPVDGTALLDAIEWALKPNTTRDIVRE